MLRTHFTRLEQIGAGSFGKVYKGKARQYELEVAMKYEDPKKLYTPQLKFEAKMYQYLRRDDELLARDCGIPTIYAFYSEHDFNVMVIELLGPSLKEMFSRCGKQFSLKTVLSLAIQILNTFEFLHGNRKVIHRDVKPSNFVMGRGPEKNKCFLIDYGLSKGILTKDQKHVAYREGRPSIGTAEFTSLNCHNGIEQSRRDDLESIGYLLIYLLTGTLPWMKERVDSDIETWHRIAEKKRHTTLEELCAETPTEFLVYMTYCKNLAFDEMPNYTYLKSLFIDLFEFMNFQDDGIYDWNLI